MAKYLLTNKAIEDLSNIWEYTVEKWSEKQADYYYNILIENFKEIALSPKIGKNYDGIEQSLYGFHVNRHIIFYQQINPHEVIIIRILHDQMDLSERIQD